MITLLHAWIAILALIGSIEQARVDRLIQASTQLKPDDDEARVLAVLGPPLARWQQRGPTASFVLGESRPRWAYGTHLDVSAIIAPDSPFPNVLPIKLRLFGPDEEDLVIIWDTDGSVASIERP